jgi:hypothetical protein
VLIQYPVHGTPTYFNAFFGHPVHDLRPTTFMMLPADGQHPLGNVAVRFPPSSPFLGVPVVPQETLDPPLPDALQPSIDC